MAAKTHRVAGVKALEPQPARKKFRVDRQARKALAARALKVRRLKQTFLGTGFLILLGAGWLYPLIGYFIPACMVLGVGLAAFRGRSWCDWLCPRGSFEDALVARISRQRRIPEVLRRTPVRAGVLTLLMGLLSFQIIRLWPDPWAIGGAFILLLTITTAVGVVLGVIYQQRDLVLSLPHRHHVQLGGEKPAAAHPGPGALPGVQPLRQKLPHAARARGPEGPARHGPPGRLPQMPPLRHRLPRRGPDLRG